VSGSTVAVYSLTPMRTTMATINDGAEHALMSIVFIYFLYVCLLINL